MTEPGETPEHDSPRADLPAPHHRDDAWRRIERGEAQQLLDCVTSGVVKVSRDGRIVYLNGQGRRVLSAVLDGSAGDLATRI